MRRRRTCCSSASTARESGRCRARRPCSRTSSSAPACARRSGCARWRRTSGGRGRRSRRRRGATRPTSPYPCEHCGFCGFRRECDARWRAEDHLSRVAWISRTQVDALSASGRRDAWRAGGAAPPARRSPDLRPATLAEPAPAGAAAGRGRHRSRLPPYELLPLEPERGFARLPDPSPGDVMFDLEGDPLWTPAPRADVPLRPAAGRGRAAGATSRSGRTRSTRSATAFQRVIDLLTARLAAHPGHARLPLQPGRAGRAHAPDGGARDARARGRRAAAAQGVRRPPAPSCGRRCGSASSRTR